MNDRAKAQTPASGESLGPRPGDRPSPVQDVRDIRDSAAPEGAISSEKSPFRLSSFIGRESEVEDAVRILLGEKRLLTLIGAGGCGKTRLSLEVADRIFRSFPDGLKVAEFASLSDPALIPKTVVSVFGLRETPGSTALGTLMHHIGRRRVLLLLDNCEHLAGACARFAGVLLANCENLRLLATSREPLGVPGEALYAVSPLSRPPSETRDGSVEAALTASEAMRYDAVRLFVERAGEADPGFHLDDSNAGDVARICAGVDGLPLAIELAAARVRVLPVAGISDRLREPLKLLTVSPHRHIAPERHLTLRATLDWSYDLLLETEKRLLRALSVFAGSFSLEAVEAITECPGGALDLLHVLVEKSLVEMVPGGRRYRMLETVRQYGKEIADGRSETETLRDLHAAYYVALAEKAEPGLREGDDNRCFEVLRAEHDNFRAVLHRGVESGGAAGGTALRLAGALWRYWDVGGHLGEGYRWLKTLLRDTEGLSTGDGVRAKALEGIGWLAIFQGSYPEAVASLRESLKLRRRLGDANGAASTLGNLVMAAGHSGDGELLLHLEEEIRGLLPQLGENWIRANLLLALALVSMNSGEYEKMSDSFSRCLALSERIRFKRGISMSLVCWGLGRLREGEAEEAARLLQRAVPELERTGDRLGLAYVLWGFGGVESRRGHLCEAAKLWGTAEKLRENILLPLSRFDLANSDYEERLRQDRLRLGETLWDEAWEAGRNLGLEAALDLVLEDEPGARPVPKPYPAGLTRREVEVLGPVARGLTNAEVAGELYITSRTVNGHLTSIYRKLGVSSRAAATRFAAENGLIPPSKKKTGSPPSDDR